MDKALSRLFMGAVGAMGIASAANGCIYDVDGGKRAIMFNRFPNPLTGEGSGIQKHIINEGTHFKMPYFQEPKIFDVRAVSDCSTMTRCRLYTLSLHLQWQVRTRPRAIPTVTGTRDLQVCAFFFGSAIYIYIYMYIFIYIYI